MSQVKPTIGGSSIGVGVAYGVNDSLVKANEIMTEVFSVNLALEYKWTLCNTVNKYTDKSSRMVVKKNTEGIHID